MNPIIKRVFEGLKNPQTLIYIAFVSVFLHYVITSVVLITLGLYLVINKNTFKKVFAFKGRGFFIAFTIYALVIALYHKNYYGAICACAFFFILAISYYVRSVITEKTFENCLDICCFAAIPLTAIAIIEKMTMFPYATDSAVPLNPLSWFFSMEERCGYLWCFNPNYFCSLLSAIIIICAFKVTSHKGGVVKYYLCAVCAAVGMYLGGSLFALVEIFVGLCVLLVLQRKHLMLAMFLAAVGISIVMIFFIPDLLPRLSDSSHTTDLRVTIWNQALDFIKENPLFGRGFLTFYQHYLESLPEKLIKVYHTTHAHNFVLEGLLSFGIIGSILFMLLAWSYYRKIAECKELLRTNCATTLILTLSAAVLVHMTTDMTIIWMQTALFYLLILGGLGIDEKALDKRILACSQSGGLSDRTDKEKEINNP